MIVQFKLVQCRHQARRQFAFNPMIVQFKLESNWQLVQPLEPFNPMIVQFKPSCSSLSVMVSSVFQSYDSSIQTFGNLSPYGYFLFPFNPMIVQFKRFIVFSIMIIIHSFNPMIVQFKLLYFVPGVFAEDTFNPMIVQFKLRDNRLASAAIFLLSIL